MALIKDLIIIAIGGPAAFIIIAAGVMIALTIGVCFAVIMEEM